MTLANKSQPPRQKTKFLLIFALNHNTADTKMAMNCKYKTCEMISFYGIELSHFRRAQKSRQTDRQMNVDFSVNFYHFRMEYLHK